ncbi:hypothetical protein F4780DRAFT_781341 [Xylariomycetidae sp. FL0641]|nr:hypothetical protein F4780DRAFT_781341 [Xylariomycetidae sp. FL0641]
MEPSPVLNMETPKTPKILLLGKIEHAHEAWASLATIATIVTPTSTTRAGFIAECEAPASPFAGTVAIFRTYDSSAVTGPVDADLLARLPASVRFVCHAGAGYDSIDVAACTARGVRVSNTPGVVDDAAADLTVWLVTGCLRNLAPAMASLRRGAWRGEDEDEARPLQLGRDPAGLTLGILGMGGIGQGVAKRAAALGMRIRYCNRSRLAEEVEQACGGAEFVEFEALLGGCDVLSLNLPLNANTHHILSAHALSLTRPGTIVVNTARGALIDEAALARALASGHLGGAGLDVFEAEPAVHPALRASDRVLLLPHLGTWTVRAHERVEACAVANVRAAVEEGRLRDPVREQRDM